VIIVNFSEIANVPPQDVHPSIIRTVYQDAQELIERSDPDSLNETLLDWEVDLVMTHRNPTEDWYTRALFLICVRGLRGDLRPNILNIS
jgi:hypothetical protein